MNLKKINLLFFIIGFMVSSVFGRKFILLCGPEHNLYIQRNNYTDDECLPCPPGGICSNNRELKCENNITPKYRTRLTCY